MCVEELEQVLHVPNLQMVIRGEVNILRDRFGDSKNAGGRHASIFLAAVSCVCQVPFAQGFPKGLIIRHIGNPEPLGAVTGSSKLCRFFTAFAFFQPRKRRGYGNVLCLIQRELQLRQLLFDGGFLVVQPISIQLLLALRRGSSYLRDRVKYGASMLDAFLQ